MHVDFLSSCHFRPQSSGTGHCTRPNDRLREYYKLSSREKAYLLSDLKDTISKLTFHVAVAGWMLYFSKYYLLPTARTLYTSALSCTEKQNPPNPFTISKINFFTALITALDCLVTLPTLVAAAFCLDGTLREGMAAFREREACVSYSNPRSLKPLPIRIKNFFLKSTRQLYKSSGYECMAILYFSIPALFVGSGHLLYGAGSALFCRFNKPTVQVIDDKVTRKL